MVECEKSGRGENYYSLDNKADFKAAAVFVGGCLAASGPKPLTELASSIR